MSYPEHRLPHCLQELYQQEIPTNLSMEGWKKVPIEESNDELINLSTIVNKKFSKNNYAIKIQPEYFLRGILEATEVVKIRKEAAKRLIYASELLPQGFELVIFDAYRPLEVQANLFDTLYKELAIKHHYSNEIELTKQTEKYVSLPSLHIDRPSPHLTGGAIDLSICNRNGKLLEMGTEFDSFDQHSKTSAFANFDKNIHNNRRLLYSVMTEAGFTNYPEEWWHYDFGNQFWALILLS